LPEVATENVNRVARWLSQKYRTLTVSMLVAQNIELFTHALSGITIILIPYKGTKYRTVRLNTGHLATLHMKYINHPPLTWRPGSATASSSHPPISSVRSVCSLQPQWLRDAGGAEIPNQISTLMGNSNLWLV